MGKAHHRSVTVHGLPSLPRYSFCISGSVNGLNPGAPVKFKGVEVGSVQRIQVLFEQTASDVSIPVYIELDADKLARAGVHGEFTPESIHRAIDQGLRGRLEPQSLVTGLLFVNLDYFPDTEAHFIGAADAPTPIVRRLANEQAPQIVAFDGYAVDLNQLEQRVDQANQLRPRERSTADLLWPEPDDPVYRQTPGRFASELHDRLSSPLYAFAFVMLVVASLGHPRTTRQNRNQAAVLAFVLAVGCRLAGIVATNAAAVRNSAIPLMYWVPLAAALLGALASQWHAYPRRPPRWVAALGGTWRSPAAKLSALGRAGPLAAASRGRS